MSHDEFDANAERIMFPYVDDEPHDVHDENYDDHDDYYDDSMDGDHDSAMTSAGMGTDEDYGCYGEDY
jgi:hypothetical protein